VIGNLQVAAENQSAARSRIMDADYAAETANLSRAQILQQAGNAMVAQANQLPQQVLQSAARLAPDSAAPQRRRPAGGALSGPDRPWPALPKPRPTGNPDMATILHRHRQRA
jgi:hypothetical protein